LPTATNPFSTFQNRVLQTIQPQIEKATQNKLLKNANQVMEEEDLSSSTPFGVLICKHFKP